jgi:hypothetical protein
MWQNTLQPDYTIWRMRVACCVTKATNIHLEYEIIMAFPKQKLLPNVSQCYVIRALPALLTSICGAQEVKPSGRPFLLHQGVPGSNLRFHRYSVVTPGLSSDRPGKGRSNISKYFTTACFFHPSTPASVHCTDFNYLHSGRLGASYSLHVIKDNVG